MKKLAFWVAVGGVAIAANAALELAAANLPFAGLKNFVRFLHSGGPQQ